MDRLPSNVKRYLQTRVPGSHIKDINAFEILSEYRFHEITSDLVAFTKRGELIEYKDNIIHKLVRLEHHKGHNDSKILVHCNSTTGNIYYLVTTDSKLYIVCANDKELCIYKQHNNVQKCEIEADKVSGNEVVKVWYHSDVIPSILNEDYETDALIGDVYMKADNDDDDESFEAMLKCKLNEAKYHTERNRNVFRENLKLRKDLCHIIREDLMTGRVIRDGPSEIICDKPWFQIWNGKLIIGVNVTNKSEKTAIEDLNLILRSDTEKWCYETKIFRNSVSAKLNWGRNDTRTLQPQLDCSILAVSEMPSFEESASVEFNGYLVYSSGSEKRFIYLSSLHLSGLKMIRGDYDYIPNRIGLIGPMETLSIIAASTIIKLDFHLEEIVDDHFLHNILKNELGFVEGSKGNDNILIHSSSPFHILQGLLVYIQCKYNGQDFEMELCARSESQILAFVNFIYGSSSPRIYIVPSGMKVNQKVAPVQKKLSESMFDGSMDTEEDISIFSETHDKYAKLSECLKRQIDIIICYLDKCLNIMGSSRKREIQDLIGSHIDLLSPGQCMYKQFCEDLESEISLGYVLLNAINSNKK